MALPDSLTPYEVLRGVESTLAFTTAQLNELAESQPDTALEGMLLSALAAVTGARASLADVRLNWDDLCAPEDVRAYSREVERLKESPYMCLAPRAMTPVEQAALDAMPIHAPSSAGAVEETRDVLHSRSSRQDLRP